MTEKEESTADLRKKLESLISIAGERQFFKAYAEAELLQYNTEILSIKNKLNERAKAAVPAPSPEEAKEEAQNG